MAPEVTKAFQDWAKRIGYAPVPRHSTPPRVGDAALLIRDGKYTIELFRVTGDGLKKVGFTAGWSYPIRAATGAQILQWFAADLEARRT